MSGALRKNMEALKIRYPKIYRELEQAHKINEYEIIECADGNKSIKVKQVGRGFLLHSRYNPAKEAENFAGEKLKGQEKINFLYGFGLGYHVIEMQKILPGDSHLYVFDIDVAVFKEAMAYNDLTAIINDRNIHLEISLDLNHILEGMRSVLAKEGRVNVILHVPSVQAIPEQLQDFKFVLEDWNIRKSVDDKYGEMLYENYLSNRKNIRRNVYELFGKFSGIPFVIVSAGPSLEKNMHTLKYVKNKAVIISVGQALKLLLNKGITPDLFVAIDPQEAVYDIIKGIEDIGIPAVFLATASRKAVEEYKGPKFIAVQDKAYALENEKKHLVQTGGSVATTSIDIALQMGGNPIILIGQDLAFSDNKHHASGYVHTNGEVDVKPLKNMRTVKGASGELLYTTLGLLSYKRWIENRIEDEKDKIFINATEGGAYIKGAQHCSLETVIQERLTNSYDIGGIIQNIIAGK